MSKKLILNEQYIIDLYLSGKDAVEISKILNCSSNTIYRCLLNNNINREVWMEHLQEVVKRRYKWQLELT